MGKLSKSEFVNEVRNIAHSEPSKDVWRNMYSSYSVYANKTVFNVVCDFFMHKGQKDFFDKRQKGFNKLWEKYINNIEGK